MFSPEGLQDNRRPAPEDVDRPDLSATKRLRAAFERTWRFEVLFGGLVLAATTLILSLVDRHSGWPLGDAFTNELVLVRLYAAHFRHLDFFPVWSSSDGLGLGTPVLLYYQKTFFYVAAPIYILLGGALKPALIAAIAIFLVVGAYGMRLALSLITPSRLLVTVGSLAFLFTNYAFTDWLSRGDLPEFSAMMLVPWLLYWCLTVLVRRRVSLVLIPVMVLLVMAHSAIGLLSLFMLVFVLLTYLLECGVSGFRAILPRLSLAVGGTVVLLAPMLLAELRMAQFYDPASKVTNYQSISNGSGFSPFVRYLFDRTEHWLAPMPHTFVQIDFAIWIPIAISVVGLAALTVRSYHRTGSFALPLRIDPFVFLFLWLTISVYVLLQLRATLIIYDLLSPLKVIDYAFRMLAFITPLGIVLVIAVFAPLYGRYRRHLLARVLPVVWLASFVLLSPVTATWRLSPSILAAPGQFPSLIASAVPSSVNYRTFVGLPTLANGILYQEYLPKVVLPHGSELVDDTGLYVRLHKHGYGGASLSSATCSLVPPPRAPLESLEIMLWVHCSAPTRFALPISYSPSTSVFLAGRHGGLRRVPTIHVPSDPRIVVDVTSSRPEVFVVHLPTLWGILS